MRPPSGKPILRPPSAVASSMLLSPMKVAQKRLLGWQYTSSGVPTCWMTPLCMMAIRSLTAKASLWSWVTYTVVIPDRFWMDLIAPRISMRSFASRLERGSSINSTSGWMTMALARAIRCCWPPDMFWGFRSRSAEICTMSSISSTRLVFSGSLTCRCSRPNATFSNVVIWGNTA